MLLREERVHIERTAADAVAGSNSLCIQMCDGESKLNRRSLVENRLRSAKVNISPARVLSSKLRGLAYASVTCDTETDNRLGWTLTLSGIPLDCSNLIPLFDSFHQLTFCVRNP